MTISNVSRCPQGGVLGFKAPGVFHQLVVLLDLLVQSRPEVQVLLTGHAFLLASFQVLFASLWAPFELTGDDHVS